jgi:hypothetical protein
MMLRCVCCLMTAVLVLPAGCAGLGDDGEGLVLRHLPMGYQYPADDWYGGGVYVVRDEACWAEILGYESQQFCSPDPTQAQADLIPDSMQIDFNNEMVIFAVAGGCPSGVVITRVDTDNDTLLVELRIDNTMLQCMKEVSDGVVVPKFEGQVEYVSRMYQTDLGWPSFLLPPWIEQSTAVALESPCTQIAP